MTQNRWKSKVAWASVASLLGLILSNFGLYEKIGITSEAFQTIINAFFGVLVAFGVLNNPTDSEAF